jgi:hypothetical protein
MKYADMDSMFRLLYLLRVKWLATILILEICYLNEILPFIKGELEPSASGTGHS